jgi:hypothetical protein
VRPASPAALMLAVLVLFAAGCGGEEPTSTPAPTQVASTPAQTAPPAATTQAQTGKDKLRGRYTLA